MSARHRVALALLAAVMCATHTTAALDSAANAGSAIDTSDFPLPAIDSSGAVPAPPTVRKGPDGGPRRLGAGTDTAMKPDPASSATEDTSYEFWTHPFLAAGASFSLGSAPLFSLWQEGLPDSLGAFAIPAVARRTDPAFPDSVDTVRLSLSAVEKPNSYNVTFPVSLSFFLPAGHAGFLGVSVCGELLTKTSILSVSDDSATNTVDLKQRLTMASAGIGVSFDFVIPPRYFLVSNVNRTSLCIGLQADPILYLRHTGVAAAHDPPDSLFNSIAGKVGALARGFSSRGWGVSWRISALSLKKYTATTALMTGLGYRGSWQYFPRLRGHDLNPGPTSGLEEAISVFSHRLSIDLQFCAGRKQRMP